MSDAPVSIGTILERVRPLGFLLEGECLLAHVLGVPREAIFAHPERTLHQAEWDQFQALWARWEAGESVAYLTGKKEFFGLEFQVDARVLVPRPETEHLVEEALRLTRGIEVPRVLDVGTGSGAIAVAFQSARPEARVWASDVSGEALEVARWNASRLVGEGRVTFFQSDLLHGIPWTELKLDVLVANLPYIGEQEFHCVEQSVEAHEPAVALFGGVDGLRLYQQLFDQINCSIASAPRWILGEFGFLQRERLESMIESTFGKEVRATFHADLAGLDRFFVLEFLRYADQT